MALRGGAAALPPSARRVLREARAKGGALAPPPPSRCRWWRGRGGPAQRCRGARRKWRRGAAETFGSRGESSPSLLAVSAGGGWGSTKGGRKVGAGSPLRRGGRGKGGPGHLWARYKMEAGGRPERLGCRGGCSSGSSGARARRGLARSGGVGGSLRGPGGSVWLTPRRGRSGTAAPRAERAEGGSSILGGRRGEDRPGVLGARRRHGQADTGNCFVTAPPTAPAAPGPRRGWPGRGSALGDPETQPSPTEIVPGSGGWD